MNRTVKEAVVKGGSLDGRQLFVKYWHVVPEHRAETSRLCINYKMEREKA